MRPKSPTITERNDRLWDAARIFQEVSPLTSPTSSAAGTSSAKKRERCTRGHPIRFMDIKVIGNWSLKNIAMAGKLLRKPPIPVQFHDEDEMRKVYSLIYDVFRYKHVLREALTDVGFFAYYPQLKQDQGRVWLLLFELYVRHFLKRHPQEADLQELIYREADLEDIANKLWEHRLKLAAAISRLRIKNGALQLSQLLPPHLKDEKVTIAAANPTVSGWINPFKFKDIGLVAEMMGKMGLVEAELDDNGIEQPLQSNQYRWDKLCPLFITCIPGDRSKFSQSDMVKKNYFVMQDKTFSVAPAILSRLLDYFQLEGDIVQTHVSSPRTTAYLAALFYSVNRLNSFLAFGTGSNLFEYRNYMKVLGITNIRLFSESFCRVPKDSELLEMVVGIFATPPNSFSGVADPIDLICSRGGDLNMLEVLTESNISIDGKKRIAQLLEVQKETLRHALLRPQVQFVLYETHSIVGSENQDMVQQAVENTNHSAFEKHLTEFEEKKRIEELAQSQAKLKFPKTFSASPKRKPADKEQSKPQQNSTKSKTSKRNPSSYRSRLDSPGSSNLSTYSNPQSSRDSSESDIENIKVPKTEQFVIAEVPEICINDDSGINLNSFGCYVSLIHRKQISKLNEKCLAIIAEKRRLMGGTERKRFFKLKTGQLDGDNDMKDDPLKNSKPRKTVQSVVDRLTRPTHASIYRSHRTGSPLEEKKLFPSSDLMKSACTRHNHHHPETYYHQQGSSAYMSAIQLDPRAKRWWQETTHYVNNLRLLEKRKKRFETQNQADIKFRPLELSYTDSSDDSSPTSHSRTDNRLRAGKTKDRKPFPVAVNRIEFKGFEYLVNNGHLNSINRHYNHHLPMLKTTTSAYQIAHRQNISRKPLGRYLLRNSQLILSY